MWVRWRMAFDLAWHGRGLTIDLTGLDHQVLEQFMTWHNEAVEEEKAKQPR